MDKNVLNVLAAEAGKENVLFDEPMERHTTFRIGGPADCLVTPGSEQALVNIIACLKEAGVPWVVIGNGSNLLVGDKGIRGVVIQLFRNFSEVTIEGGRIFAQAGAMLSGVARAAAQQGLTGLEFASGIPGTIGGGAVMNAGAYGGELKDVITSVRLLAQNGQVRQVSSDEMTFGYRTSAAQTNGDLILGVEMQLQAGDPESIAARMEELKEKRTSKQPLDKPSAGSTFKRPEGYFAGKLIMDAGLRGYTVGGAQVSEKHCGFVINTGGATAMDVRTLMENVRQKVFEQFGVTLEPEVKMLGEF